MDFFPNECSCPPGSTFGAWSVRGMKFTAGIWPLRYDVWHYWQGIVYCSRSDGLTKIYRVRWHRMDGISPWEFVTHSGNSCNSENCREQISDSQGNRRLRAIVTTTGQFRACVTPHHVCRERQPRLVMTVQAGQFPPAFTWSWA
ncbi:MAG TPA: hypothetical protein VE615_11300 [Gaiellaceae bacterium]|nr:hypothetical protein [Gaiellaceae bacterium]